MAACGVAAGQETMLDYWFVPGSEWKPEAAPRVIREGGEKDGRFVPAYDDLRLHPLIREAWFEINRKLRQEATQLAQEYREQGMTPVAAYEKAWTRAYKRHLEQAGALDGRALVEHLLERLVAADGQMVLTDDEVQLALQVLALDDELLKSEQGRSLLARISRHLMALGIDLGQPMPAANDDLMGYFASALKHGMEGPNAFRDAYFKLNRDRIAHYELPGYRAPWGSGAGAGAHLRPIPRKKVKITQAAAPDKAKPADNATTTPREETDATTDENEEKTKFTSTTSEQDETSQLPAVPGVPSSAPMRFAMMRAAAAAPAAAGVTYTWSGASGNTTWRADGSAENSGWGSLVEQGIYTNGSSVVFDDAASSWTVNIMGEVAPGSQIRVDADTIQQTSGTDDAALTYGYAFTGSGSIADYTDGSGVLHQTSILQEGKKMLVLNTVNSFSGGITLATGTSLYIGCAHAAGEGAIRLGDDSTLYVNYHKDDPSFRTPSLTNTLVIDEDAAIRPGIGSYGEDRIPSDWRTLTLSGGISGGNSGKGTLTLYGYSYLVKPTTFAEKEMTFNYVSNIAINERHAEGEALSRFSGTVYLKNEFVHRDTGTQEIIIDKDKHVGGAVQLTLVDDVFSDATLNMVRDYSKARGAGHNQGRDGAAGYAITSDNILVLSENSQIQVKALEAAFRGVAFVYNFDGKKDNGSYKLITSWRSDYEQEHERWLVRVVTDGYTNLVLEDKDETATHVFSGSMGYAHSYTTASQPYIHAPFESSNDYYAHLNLLEPSNPGAGSLGVELLSLEKRGAATQYIHSANLQNLSVVEGTVGFNHLALSGNLNLVGGSSLVLGVTGTVGTVMVDGATKNEVWNSIADTNTELQISSGNRLLVVAPAMGTAPADVQGELTLNAGASLEFYVMRTAPSTLPANSLLSVSGNLNLQADTPISLTFSSLEFAKNAGTQTYYLASAEDITVDGKDASTFKSQMVPLGYGYYGILSTVYNKNSDDYLVLAVVGDPRRTWSGYPEESLSVWKHEDGAAKVADNHWKEKLGFQNGHLVLFGNRYEPVGWNDANWVATAATTSKVSDTLGKGTLETVTVDGEQIANVDKICVSGEVAPAAFIINADYFDKNGVEQVDNTNYYFYADAVQGGKIRDVDTANSAETALLPGLQNMTGVDLSGWKTSLRKLGTGTAIINLANSFSGGTTIEGGRLVMQNPAALGDASGGITIQNGAMLQGDFADTSHPTFTYGDPYAGEKLGTTTTVLNPVNVVVYQDPDNPDYDLSGDAYIANASGKKMVLSQLTGAAETVLTLYGSSNNPTTSTTHTYAVFKVLNPGGFYGTIKLDGNLVGSNVYQNLWDGDDTNNPAGGRVQMEIMTTAKSGGDAMSAAGKTPPDWLHTTIDLSVENGTERTVLALDALGTDNAAGVQEAQVAALQGTSTDGSRMNSSVLSMSQEKTVVLEIEGMVNGDYDGVLGFGDFQKSVDYDNAGDAEIGIVKHHYGRKWDGGGVLDVRKLGSSTQSVNSAWLNELSVGYTKDKDGAEIVTQGGTFVVDEALVVSSLKIADGMHVVVGNYGGTSSHALTVGAGGILAFDSVSGDAFAGIGAGIPKRTEEVTDGGTTITIREVAPEAFVLLGDGATITGFSDWSTDRQRVETINGVQTSLEVGIDIESSATVTFNTHNYTPDDTISAKKDEDVFGCYTQSNVIQLLGQMRGSNVNLIFNNELISAAALQAQTATRSADGSEYIGAVGTEMGHVAIRDIHQFTGNITVKNMTALQVTQSNTAANAATADMEVTVTGKNGALQFVDGVTDQYINQVNLEQGGHILLGGELQNKRTGWTSLVQTQVEVDIAHREGEGKPAGSLNNLDLVKNTSNKSISIGGTSDTPTVAANVHITSLDTAENYDTVVLHHTELQSSIMEMHAACQLDIADMVTVDRDSQIRGANVETAAPVTAPVSSVSGNVATTSTDTTVQLTFGAGRAEKVGDTVIYIALQNQIFSTDVTGDGLTIQFADNILSRAYQTGAAYLAVQVNGGSGQFLYESIYGSDKMKQKIDDGKFKVTDAAGNVLEGIWVTSTEVGADVSSHMLYFLVPEPATTTLSLLALTALCARRRRK